MKYRIEVWVNSTAYRDFVDAAEEPDPRDVMAGEWKRPIQVEVERLAREGYHRAEPHYPSLPHRYFPPHSISCITYRETK